MTTKTKSKKLTVTEDELSVIVSKLVAKKLKSKVAKIDKLVAIENEWVSLKTVGTIQASIMPKNDKYENSSVFLKGGFKSKGGMSLPLTQNGLDNLRGTLDLIEKQCF